MHCGIAEMLKIFCLQYTLWLSQKKICFYRLWSFVEQKYVTSSNRCFSWQITYGSVIKLMHEKTRFRLHSHEVPYGSGSGQQSVTGFPNVDDANSYWVGLSTCFLLDIPYCQVICTMSLSFGISVMFQTVKRIPESSAKQGAPIKSGTIIRLQHMRTRKWLHSHLHMSPISGNQEVIELDMLHMCC